MKPKDLEACASAFARWADPAKHGRVLLMSPDPEQAALFRRLLPGASITEWHIQHYNIDDGPPPESFDLAFAANTFLCAVDPEAWLRNVLSRCDELWLQEPVRAWRDGWRETSPETGDHSRFTFPSRGELSRIPGFDLEASEVAQILDIEFYSDDGAGAGEDYKDCRKFVVRLGWKGFQDVPVPSCVIPGARHMLSADEAVEPLVEEDTAPMRKPKAKKDAGTP